MVLWAGTLAGLQAQDGLGAGTQLAAQNQDKSKPAKPGTEPGQTKPPTGESAPQPPPLPEPAERTAAAGQPPGRTGEFQFGRYTPLTMLGDASPIGIPGIAFGRRGNPQFPGVPGQFQDKVAGAAIAIPSVRGFKISEHESPEPQDRIYVAFNYYDHLNQAVNEHFGGDIQRLTVYRETFGVEKMLFSKDFSIGLRLPLNTLDADSGISGLGGSSTDTGDLTVIMKYAFWRDQETGSLLSTGLAITAPTGPDAFAGVDSFRVIHDTIIQPYLGYRWTCGDFFIHGFASLDVPTDSNDATILFNDVGVGYHLLHADESGCRFVTAIVPTLELHVNTPLNHRGALNPNDVAGIADIVDLTLGTTVEMKRCSKLTVGFVTPLTGPKPFDFEVLAEFGIYFGSKGRCN
jgi:hypothetical protein